MKTRSFILAASMIFTCLAQAETHEYVVDVKSYNADIQEFVLNEYGVRPVGAVAYFWNKFGATTGNRFNQIPRNNTAELYLDGFEGCTVKSVTLNMCSNIKSGQVGLNMKDKNEFLKVHAEDFCDLFGTWLSKDHNIYADVVFPMETAHTVDSTLVITIKGGLAEGSVYLRRIVVEYDTPDGIEVESPMGWVFQKVEAKGTVEDGDVIMLYRTGSAAADFDGMETSHYLDVTGVTSTSNVYEPDVLQFKLHKTEDKHWTLTDQWGRVLGAKGKQNLAWDEGVMTWDIKPGYNGAEISSTNTNYGTIRYNAPDGSYARFWNYTSTSLALPYIYKRIRQNEPVKSTSLSLPWDEREVEMSETDTLCVHAKLLPTSVTDTRVGWTSSQPEVATVKDGIVFLHSAGTTVITAKANDGGSEASFTLTVIGTTEGVHLLKNDDFTDKKRLFIILPNFRTSA